MLNKFHKVAVIGIDVEDWYHIDYLRDIQVDKKYSMLDGLDEIVNTCNAQKIKATFFVVAEIANSIKKKIIELKKSGHEIASHGLSHKRPLLMSKKEFTFEICESKEILERILKDKIDGFRAPCFSINRELIEELIKNNYRYDSSKINFKSHPLYGCFDLEDFNKIEKLVYKKSNFFEFELPTANFFNFGKVPFSGGGYLRIFNTFFIKRFIKKMEFENSPIFFYLHPFEFSKKKIPMKNIPIKSLIRMNIGRKNVNNKFNEIILYMKKEGWKFETFKSIIEKYK